MCVHSRLPPARLLSLLMLVLVCMQVIAELPRASSRQPAAILSSIEFDRDRSMFATAGVSKRISLYSFDDVLEHSHVQEHCPASELITRSKLSCLSWNK